VVEEVKVVVVEEEVEEELSRKSRSFDKRLSISRCYEKRTLGELATQHRCGGDPEARLSSLHPCFRSWLSPQARLPTVHSGRDESELSLSRVANTRPPQVHGAVQPRSEVGQDLSVIVGATVF
jgi:hypothetical protein